MAGGQNLVGVQIPGDLGHEREREAGELKGDDERVQFYTLLAPGTHRGGGNRSQKEAALVCS